MTDGYSSCSHNYSTLLFKSRSPEIFHYNNIYLHWSSNDDGQEWTAYEYSQFLTQLAVLQEKNELRTIVRLDKIMPKTPKVIELVQNRGQSRTQMHENL